MDGVVVAVIPQEIARAALAAELHLQLKVERVELPQTSPGVATFHGRVVRVFRGDSQRLGAPLAVRLHNCIRNTREEGPPEGYGYTLVGSLVGIRVLEAFLDRGTEGYDIVYGEYAGLDAPTDTPRMAYTEADTRIPKPNLSKRLAEGVDTAVGLVLSLGFVTAGLAGLAYAVWLLLR